MCGIAGIVSQALSPIRKRELLTSMLACLQHRGPDGSEIYADQHVGIAAARLAIVGRRDPDVLIWNEDRTVLAALNGEIYNHDHLRASLRPTHNFRTRTDTEVLVHAFEGQGADAIQHLNGDFAFVIWDTNAESGLIARDPLGVKPLYFAHTTEAFVFATEIKALLAFSATLSDIDEESLYHFLSLRFVPHPRTIFKQIHKLPPGHFLPLPARDSQATTLFWKLPLDGATEVSYDATARLGQRHLEDAVRRRVPDEVDFGVLLSGGIDSSLIAATATALIDQPVRTFTVVFESDDGSFDENSEHLQSRLIADTIGSLHTELSVSPAEFQDACRPAIFHLDDLTVDPPAPLVSLICKKASESVRVLLSGEGADELFAGYRFYHQYLTSPRPYPGMGYLLWDHEKRRLMSSSILAKLSPELRSDSLLSSLLADRIGTTPLDRLHQLLYTDLNYWLADLLLLKADKMSMRSAVETRVPYLDANFVEFAFSLPSEYKLVCTSDKVILRDIARRILPTEIAERPKRGFPLPLGSWLRGPLRPWVEELVLSNLATRQYFDRIALRSAMESYFQMTNSPFWDHVVWSLVVLELYHQEVLRS